MQQSVHFHGLPEERLALMAALNSNCTCQIDTETGGTTGVCPGHAMLVSDQRALNGLLFARRQIQRFLLEEFDLKRRDSAQAIVEYGLLITTVALVVLLFSYGFPAIWYGNLIDQVTLPR